MKKLNLIGAGLWVLQLLFLTGCSLLDKVDKDLLTAAEMCVFLNKTALKDMEFDPLYTRNGANCNAVTDPDKSITTGYFSDAACQIQVDYRPEKFTEFCLKNLGVRDYLGNPKAWYRTYGSSETDWSLDQASRVDIGAVKQYQNNHRPYLKRVRYRTVGNCELGMYIYKRNVGAEDQKAFMFVHGGGWKYRGFGALFGAGITVPNITEKGYVVFAPYYRLTGHSDGPAECQEATGQQILDDIEAALHWVLENGEDYGVDPAIDKIAVGGQSAGGHLAGYLATHYPDKVERALLLYPATDFKFYIEQTRPGGIYESFSGGRGFIKAFVAQDVATVPEIDVDTAIVEKDSFPEIVEANASGYPPMYILHGSQDATAPVEMSTRMCDALDPAAVPSNQKYAGGGLSKDCGDGSQIRIINGAGHIMDMKCLSPALGKWYEKRTGSNALCFAGTKQGERATRNALKDAFNNFLLSTTD